MGVKSIAETLILQCMEDLWDEKHRSESIDFFTGPDFHFYADLAGLDMDKKIELLRLVKRVSRHTRHSNKRKGIIPRPADRAGSSPHALSASPATDHSR